MTSLPEIHITSDTTLLPAIRSWEVFLYDQGRSRFTIKAFLGDLNLFTSFFAPDTAIGQHLVQMILTVFWNGFKKKGASLVVPRAFRGESLL